MLFLGTQRSWLSYTHGVKQSKTDTGWFKQTHAFTFLVARAMVSPSDSGGP